MVLPTLLLVTLTANHVLSFHININSSSSSSSRRPRSEWHTRLDHRQVTLADDDNVTEDDSFNNKDFFIEKVSTKARALDVRVFRGFSMSAVEYVSEQHSAGKKVSETMAIDYLMKNYDEHGQYIFKRKGMHQNDPINDFIAIYNGTQATTDMSISRQNGLAGVVSTKLCHTPPPVVGPDIDGTPSMLLLSSTVPIPSSHLYVANLRVDDSMQRRGIGMALLTTIKDYVNTLALVRGSNIPLILSVESDNTVATNLYQKFGFEYLEKNSDWGTMILV